MVRPALANKAGGKTEQTVAGLVFLGLCGWAWRLFAQDAKAAGGGLALATSSSALPFRSLYDMPSRAVATRTRRFGTAPRVGRPPPLR